MDKMDPSSGTIVLTVTVTHNHPAAAVLFGLDAPLLFHLKLIPAFWRAAGWGLLGLPLPAAVLAVAP